MPNTKDFIPVQEVKENSVILQDGTVVMVIQTSAVNFDLLSEPEQLAIIGSFAGLLNSLSFSIQILIRSKKLDISHYLNTLREAEKKQHNPLLQLMMQHYRAFVAAIIRDNEVLDKQFYVVLSVSPIETGLVKSSDAKGLEKALTILNPRRDHILKQLSRIGLKSDQLDNEKLIRLFYDIYNNEDKISLNDVQGNPANQTPANTPNKLVQDSVKTPPPSPDPVTPPLPYVQTPATTVFSAPATHPPLASSAPQQFNNVTMKPSTPPPQPLPQAGVVNAPPPAPPATTMPAPGIQTQHPAPNLYASPQPNNRNPFVVEELPS